jgi:hypothetical protein
MTALPARIATASGVLAVLLVASVAAAGDSAAVPGLGAGTWYPPWDAGLGLSSAQVTVVLVIACLLGALAVGSGLLAVHRGARPTPRTVAVAALGAVILLTAVPPLGSADHLSYAAYGRIAAAGDDPYLVDPLQWRDGTDPVAGAIQPPWQHTHSVYGPVTTAAQATIAWLGHGSLRATVWFWHTTQRSRAASAASRWSGVLAACADNTSTQQASASQAFIAGSAPRAAGARATPPPSRRRDSGSARALRHR